MAEREKDDVGSTGARSVEGSDGEAAGTGRSGGASSVAKDGDTAVVDDETAESRGTIISGGGNSGLTQSGGGSVD
jgi:hypothetical protein